MIKCLKLVQPDYILNTHRLSQAWPLFCVRVSYTRLIHHSLLQFTTVVTYLWCAVSQPETAHVDLLALVLFLYLLLSVLVVLQPRNVVVIVELQEELNKGVFYKLSRACSFRRVLLQTI